MSKTVPKQVVPTLPAAAAHYCLCVQDVAEEMPTFNVSYKPQKISPKFEGSVRQLLHKKIRDSYLHPQVRWLTA